MKLGFILPFMLVVATRAGQPGISDRSEMDGLFAQAARYQIGDNMEPLRQVESLVRQALSDSSIREHVRKEMPQLLAPPATFAARRFACQQLAILGDESALPHLARLLRTRDDVGFACLTLAVYPPGKADKVLREALPDTRGLECVQLLHTIGDRRDPKAVTSLIKLARSDDLPAAEAAIIALGQIGDSAARKAILGLEVAGSALGSALLEAEARIAEQLVKAGDRKHAAAIYEKQLRPTRPAAVRRAALSALLSLDSDGGEQRILQTLSGSDEALRPVALAAVRSLPAATASQRFARELPALSGPEQVLLLESLMIRGDAAARSAMLTGLQAPSPEVRIAAAQALAQIGDASCVPALAKALAVEVEPSATRKLAAFLGRLPGGAETDEALIRQVQAAYGETRARLLAALAQRHSPAVIATLFAETSNPQDAVLKAAYHGLASQNLGDQISTLLQKFVSVRDPGIRAELEPFVAQAVVNADTEIRSKALRQALSRPCEPETRCALLPLLAVCGDDQCLAALITALGESNSQIHDAAVRTLADWPNTSAWQALLEVWRSETNDSRRLLALRALVRLADENNSHPDQQLIDRYRELLRGAQNEDELRLVLGALGGLGHPDALKLALPLLEKPAIRPETEAAIRKIAEAVKDQYPQLAQEAFDKLRAK
jgi:HEAT repeat protein